MSNAALVSASAESALSEARQAILTAAEEIFAAKGFAATTIKDIGKSAQVNSALLYYYYDSKETLYRAVILCVVADFVKVASARLSEEKDPAAAIRTLVTAQAELLSARPNFLKLLVREMIDHRAAHAEQAILNLAAGLFARLCDVIKAGQARGDFRSDLDPRSAAISTISQVVYHFIARPAIGVLMGRGVDQVTDADSRAFAVHAADFALAALRATPPDGRHLPDASAPGSSAR